MQRARPVAPVYAPEIAARAIVWAAGHRRREVWVGFPTYYTIIGNWFAPWVEDRYLAKKAFDGQQTEQPLEPGRPDYLFAPLDDDADHGTNGSFGDEAKARSLQVTLTLHRRAIAAGVAALGTAAAAGATLARR